MAIFAIKTRKIWKTFWEPLPPTWQRPPMMSTKKSPRASGMIWCTASMGRILKTLSAIFQIQLTAAVWNGVSRGVFIWFSQGVSEKSPALSHSTKKQRLLRYKTLSVCAFAANIPSDDNEQYVLATGIYEV
ncbi:MAG TPA: hypothetical protein H9709_02110 [Candidatus Gemmiger stercoripullorum]|nr:hypothetical protein [Candidatus Gemmiger stercoripullorum]